MNYDIYSQEIQDCINKIRKTRSTDVKIILSCCQQLLDYGKKYNDSQLLGFSYLKLTIFPVTHKNSWLAFLMH
ncbi:MAG: hypothetical protein ACOCNB_09015 [Acetivibrio ethanolgignens]